MSNRMQNILNGLLGLTDRPELLTQSSPATMLSSSNMNLPNMDLNRLNNSIATPQRMVGDISQTVDGAQMPTPMTMNALRTPPLSDNGMFTDDSGAFRISYGANKPVTNERVDLSNVPVEEVGKGDKGILDRMTGAISDFVYPDGEVNWGLVAGLNAMTLKPDAGIQTMAAQGMKDSAQRRKNKASAQKFYEYADKFAQTDPEKSAKYKFYADQLAENNINVDDAVKGMDKSSGITINTGEKANLEREKAIIKNATKLDELSNQAYSTIGEIDQLMAISKSQDLNDMPFWLRQIVPTGVITSVDAYNAGLVKVAKGLRVPGEGHMSDKDVELLIQGAGSLAATQEGREIAHIGLKRAQEIKIKVGQIAQDYLAGNIDAKEYYRRQNELKKTPLFSEDERKKVNMLLERDKVPKYSDFNEEELEQLRKAGINNESEFNALPISIRIKQRPQR